MCRGPVFYRPFVLPPFRSADQEKLNLLCPVRALHWTHTFTGLLSGGSPSSYLCALVHPEKVLPATKQTLSRWIVDAISLAYEHQGLPSPVAVRAHSTRGMAASKALGSGASLDVCNAAGWSSPLTYVRFYGLDLDPCRVPGSLP